MQIKERHNKILKYFSYLYLIRAAGSLLFDARHHVFLHVVQSRVQGGELRLQVLLDSGGVRLVSQQK